MFAQYIPKQRLIASLVTLAMVVGGLILCTQTMVGVTHHGDLVASAQSDNQQVPCCNSLSEGVHTLGRVTQGAVVPTSSRLLAVSAAVLFFIGFSVRMRTDEATGWLQRLRQRIGSFRIYYWIQFLLHRGILHPRVW